MFHSNPRARTATQELGTRCLVNRPTSASPPHVRTEYAQNTPEAVPRGCHEARTAMYGHCDEAVKGRAGTVNGCTGAEKGKAEVNQARRWSDTGKAEKLPEIFWRRGSL